jgi:hypothetical protein
MPVRVDNLQSNGRAGIALLGQGVNSSITVDNYNGGSL